MIALTSRRVLVLVVVLSAIGIGVERLVVTDQEAIESLLETATTAVSRDDWPGFASTIDDDYRERGRDKAAFVAYVRGLKERHKPQGVGLELVDTSVDGDHGTCQVVMKPGAPYIGIRIPGRIDFARTPGGWRISGVTEAESNYLGR